MGSAEDTVINIGGDHDGRRNSQKKKNHETANYHRTQMQKEIVIQRLREQGCRITKQRLMLLDVILNEDCSCCKEIYYRAAEVDPGIGAATVYRMVNLLEEIGAISRKNMYRIACGRYVTEKRHVRSNLMMIP